MSEFGEGDMLCPGSGVGGTKDPKIGFYLLIDLFSFSVSLRMIGSGKGEFITKELSKFLSKGRSELRSSVRDDFVI